MGHQDDAREPRHYDELGVAPTASPAEIRAAYVALARRHHPDRMGTSSDDVRARSATRMARVNAAWTVLSDPTLRQLIPRAHVGWAVSLMRLNRVDEAKQAIAGLVRATPGTSILARSWPPGESARSSRRPPWTVSADARQATPSAMT